LFSSSNIRDIWFCCWSRFCCCNA